MEKMETRLIVRGLRPAIITGHTGWTENLDFAFAHWDKLCSLFRRWVPEPNAPYDAYDESEDTEEQAKEKRLLQADRSPWSSLLHRIEGKPWLDTMKYKTPIDT